MAERPNAEQVVPPQGTFEALLAKVRVDLDVANATDSMKLATAILRFLEEGRLVQLRTIGPHAMANATKAVAIANGELGSQGSALWVLPAFDARMIRDRNSGRDVEYTAMKLIVAKVSLQLMM